MKPLLHLLATVTAAAVVAACDRTPATTLSQNEFQAPRPVRLPDDVRARIEGRLDVAAVEELLATMHPDDQDDFLVSIGGTGSAPAGGETRDVSVLTRST